MKWGWVSAAMFLVLGLVAYVEGNLGVERTAVSRLSIQQIGPICEIEPIY